MVYFLFFSCRSFEKRSAEAEPGFDQTFQAGFHSLSYDCSGPAGCGQNVGGYTFNRQNIQNHATHFNQHSNQGSRATNFSHGKKKRSAKADARPQFTQTFQPGSFSQSYDCTGPNGCGEGVGRVTHNTQNLQNHFDPWYNGGSTGAHYINY